MKAATQGLVGTLNVGRRGGRRRNIEQGVQMIIIVVIASVTVIVIAIAVARRRATATHDDDVVVVLLSASGNKGVYDAQPIPHGVGWSGDACHVIRDRHKIKNPERASHWRDLICPSQPINRPT